MATNSNNPERSFMHWKTKLKRRGATKEQLRPGASYSIYPTEIQAVGKLGKGYTFSNSKKNRRKRIEVV